MGNSLFGLLFLVISFSLTCCNWVEAVLCKDGERRALTKFRNGLYDPLNRLSSWDDLPDCCKWGGITCNKKTGYVIKLDLLNTGNWNLSGELDPSLLELKHLSYLDLSFNSFDGNSIPAFLGSLTELRYLNLSGAGFKGIIPSQLGNLSMLEYLDVSCYEHWNVYLHGLAIDNLQWLGKMTNLKYLNMNGVDLSSTNEDWLHILNRLPSLIEVHLGNCYLSAIPLTLPFVNITALRVLGLSSNQFYSMIPTWIISLNNLVSLDLSSNDIYGPIPFWFPKLELLQEIKLGWNYDLQGNLSHILEGFGRMIKRIDLSGNNFKGEIPGSIGNMTSLIELDLMDNGITGSIPESISNLRNLEVLRLNGNGISGEMILDKICRLKKLKDLLLKGCMLSGPIPRCLGELSFLETLDLGSNNLSGVLPETLGQLAHLETMFIGDNSLSGTVSRVHFRNLSKLKELNMSSNSLALQFHEWSPPFQLHRVILSSCNLGPYFPSWLKLHKNMSLLDISNTSISDDIPDGFWDFTPQMGILDLSYNKIKGNLPDPFKMKEDGYGFYLDISNNNFSGPLPQGLGHFKFFLASNNHINGTIPLSIVESTRLSIFDLSRNKLKGNIPPTIGNCTGLKVLDLSENFLQGEIPESLGHIRGLTYLHLNKNNISGGIPNLLNSSGSLRVIDLGENNLFGDIPPWIGDIVALKRLSLRANLFSGEIPLHLSKASSLQVLDLSENKLIGTLPPNFGNLSAMRIQNMFYFSELIDSPMLHGDDDNDYKDKLLVTTKNQILEYTRILPLVTSLDLSNNDLVGDVPDELTRLVGLHTLNLSGNHFTGKIPENIGNLNLLESLDLSKNQFLGLIPQSLSNMTSLVYLNLSYNNLSGTIPTGPQLQLLDKSSYIGNAQLCGPPLSDCPDVDLTRGDKATSSNEEGGGDEMAWFYAGIGPGFAMVSHPERSRQTKNKLQTLVVFIVLSILKEEGEISGSIENMTLLIELRLSQNGINESIPESISILRNLKVLDLAYNGIIGSIPKSIINLRNLEILVQISGVLPKTLGQLAYLTTMLIGSNSLSGTVSGVHFRNLSKLGQLDMSSNSLAFQFHDWSPPFQLVDVWLSSCNLGPNFPSWLKLQKDTISILDISIASISYDMPDWFWDFVPQLLVLDLSSNKIKGNLPDPFKMRVFGIVCLNSNLFWGPLPNLFYRDDNENKLSVSLQTFSSYKFEKKSE
ncbi:receptor-like protein EIX2 [Aristolochia californica]|uniref:receptor-like protein EIX2 n=1 Tax=Aristolochia californica TaxID=171875 RepID=UPI0035DBE423